LMISVFLFKEKEIKKLISKEFLIGYLVLLLTSLPWVLLFIDHLGFEQAVKLVKERKILSRQGPFYLYFVEIWGQFFPLVPSSTLMGLYGVEGEARIWHSDESLFLIWFILLFTLLTLFKVRASRYLLSGPAPSALIIGGLWKKEAAALSHPPCLVSLLIWQLC